MALTKITQGVIKPNENFDTNNINSTGVVTATSFDGNINSGVVTATDSLKVGSAVTITSSGVSVPLGITTVAELHVGVDTGFFNEDLVVNGDARITGIFTVGRDTLIFDGLNNQITVGSGVTIDGSSGIITATRFVGDGSNLSGIDATSLKDADGNIVAQAVGSGLVITGVTTVSNKLMVGDSYISAGNIGLGTTTTAGRDAGIGTAAGSMIYNATTGSVQVYKSLRGWVAIDNTGDAPPPPPSGITATGGIINDYEDGGTYYRTHTFINSGTFDVTDVDSSSFGTDVDYLVVAGGGGGGIGGDATISAYQAGGGGAGAGGLLTSDPTAPAPTKQTATPVSAQSYTVTIGAGGMGGHAWSSYAKHGRQGSDSVFGSITATGGGGGVGNDNAYNGSTKPGGSGGGGEGWSTPASLKDGGTATNYPGPTQQGFPGGNAGGPSAPERYGGGGGGAGAAGNPGETTTPAPTRGQGGVGLNLSLSGTSTGYAGGGSGGRYTPSPGTIAGPPIGGGGTGASEGSGGDGAVNRGAGGGGGHASTVANSTAFYGGQGGSGIVVLRYQISQSQTGTAKATGGNVSFYKSKTLHVFTDTADFNVTSPISGAEFILVGGGGAGGNGKSVPSYASGGGGGAGGVVIHTGPVAFAPGPHAVVVGAGGATMDLSDNYSNPGTSSTLVVPGVATYSAYRGGGGGAGYISPTGGDDGGSGGGGSAPGPGSSGGSAVNPAANPGATEYGFAGGTAPGTTPAYPSGGGGGAGAVGENGFGGPANGTAGGIGIQLPATYQDPKQNIGVPGPGGGGYWVAGGGGGGVYVSTNPVTSLPAKGYGGAYNGSSVVPGTGPYSGGGQGSGYTQRETSANGVSGTGGGGGGSGISPQTNPYPVNSGQGGSGLVIIAYPT